MTVYLSHYIIHFADLLAWFQRLPFKLKCPADLISRRYLSLEICNTEIYAYSIRFGRFLLERPLFCFTFHLLQFASSSRNGPILISFLLLNCAMINFLCFHPD